jgi:hypothetical protein
MGHSDDDVADDYGSGHSLYRLVEGMKLYRVPGVNTARRQSFPPANTVSVCPS